MMYFDSVGINFFAQSEDKQNIKFVQLKYPEVAKEIYYNGFYYTLRMKSWTTQLLKFN